MARTPLQPTLESPCIRNCCLDSDDYCMGCGRHLEEILRWRTLDNAQREIILSRASVRRKKSQIAPD